MLWHIELKFCTWLCLNELQFKCECRDFVAIFEGVMPLFIRLSSGGMYYQWYGDVCPSGSRSISQSFPHFSPTCFDIFSWNCVCQFLIMNRWSSLNVLNFPQFCWSYAPFGFLYPGNNSFQHFSPTCFDILSWNFGYDFIILYYRSCSSVVKFAAMFVGVMPLLELRILEIHSFPHFSPTCFDILTWNFAYYFVSLYYRSSSSDVNLRQFL